QVGALELNHGVAALALQVLVLRVAVVVLVAHPRPDLQAAQEAGVEQLGQGAVDGGPADLEAGLLDVVDELVGVEVVVTAEDVADQVALLSGEALRPGPAGQVLAELVFGTLRHGDRWQLHGPPLPRTRPNGE